MPAASNPHPLLVAQCAILVLVVAVAELAPRPGLAALYLPLLARQRHAALDWALAHGAALNGPGPLGGLILTAPPTGLAARAFRDGALAIAIPSILCQPPEPRPHG